MADASGAVFRPALVGPARTFGPASGATVSLASLHIVYAGKAHPSDTPGKRLIAPAYAGVVRQEALAEEYILKAYGS